MQSDLLVAYGADPTMFASTHVVVIGDIALDVNLLCRPAKESAHGRHGGETIFDVEHLDRGSVGSANASAIACRSLGASVSLGTCVGKDPEGASARRQLALAGVSLCCIELSDVCTSLKIRAFVKNEHTGRYELHYRFDRDPDPELGHASMRSQAPTLLSWFDAQLEKADAVLINDIEKGLLSAEVVAEIGRRIVLERDRRHPRPGPLTVVDPKRDWHKFLGFPVDVMKPNLEEACKAIGIFNDRPNLADVAAKLFEQHGFHFERFVVTLGHEGAMLIELTEGEPGWSHFPAFATRASSFHVTTHCGDVFGGAMTLGLVHGHSISSAITFANAAGSLQASLLTGIVDLRKLIDRSDEIISMRPHLPQRAAVAIQKPSVFDAGPPMQAQMRRDLAALLNLRRPVTVWMVDMDNFKDVNENEGHEGGNRVLAKVFQILQSCVRGAGKAYRYGGDEFCVITKDADGDVQAGLAELARRTVEEQYAGSVVPITLSIGIAGTWLERWHVDELIQAADQALYAAKRRRNSVVSAAPQ